MSRWFSAEKGIFAASVLLFALALTNAQRNWLTPGSSENGKEQLEGAGGAPASDDWLRVVKLESDFARFSLPDGRNVFEALDRMLPLPPVTLELPELPAPSVLAPLFVPAPPSRGHEVARVERGFVPATSIALATLLEPPPPAVIADDEAALEGAADGEEGSATPEEGEAVVEEPAAEPVPAPIPTPDRFADDRVRPYATLNMKSGASVEGAIVRDQKDSIVLELPGDERVRRTYQKRDIESIVPALTLAQVVDGDFAKLRQNDDGSYIKLFDRWLNPAAPPEALAVAEEWALRAVCSTTRRLDLVLRIAAHFRERRDIDNELATLECARQLGGQITAVEVLGALADVYSRIGLTVTSQQLLEDALLRKRNDEPVRLLLANLHVEGGQYEQAITLIEALGPVAMGRAEIATVRARAEYQAGNLETAHELLSVATIDTSSAPLETLLLRGAAAAALGRLEDARGDWSAILERLADEPSYLHARMLGAAHHDLGVIAVYQGKSDEAAQHFQDAMRCDPTTAHPLLGLGFLAECAGDLATARTFYERAQKIEPALGATQLALGRINEAVAGGDAELLAEARRRYQLAFVADFELTEAVARLGYLAAASGHSGRGPENFFEALDFLGEASRRIQDNRFLELEIAHCHLALGDLAAAERIFEEIRRATPGDVNALAGLAYVKNAKGEELRARAYLEDLARQTDLPPALASFASDGMAAIDRNLARWRWVDTFNRSGTTAGDDPRREWVTVQEVGVRVYLDPKLSVVRFEGTQAADAPDVPSRLEREVKNPGEFVSFSARLDTTGSGKTAAVISMRFNDEKRPSELQWGRTSDGKLGWRMISRGVEDPWETIADYPSGDFHTLGIEVVTGTGKQRSFRLLLDGVVLRGDDSKIKSTQLTATGAKDVRIGVTVSAPAYEEVRLTIDDVELIEERPKK